MVLAKRILLLVSICTIFGHLGIQVFALKCYVCNDCEIYYNETHLIECGKSEERCLTMVLANGEFDRACGSKDSCTRAAEPPSPTTVKQAKVKKREEFPESIPKKRTVRELLQKLPEKVEEPPPTKETPEFSSMHCCKEDECNSAMSAFSISTNKLKFPILLFLNTLAPRHQLSHSTFYLLLLTSIFIYAIC